MNETFRNRQQYIRSSNEMNRGVNNNQFIQGSRQKAELDRKLEEISINSGQSFSGSIVRQNLLRSSASSATTLSSASNYDYYAEQDTTDNSNDEESSLKNGVNRGKDNLQSMREFNQNNNFNRFNRNI